MNDNRTNLVAVLTALFAVFMLGMCVIAGLIAESIYPVLGWFAYFGIGYLAIRPIEILANVVTDEAGAKLPLEGVAGAFVLWPFALLVLIPLAPTVAVLRRMMTGR